MNRSHADWTTVHVHRACTGEKDSLTWLIAHFTPLLHAQAEYRLRGPLRRICDPEDLVDDVWASALPRLRDLRARSNRLTPVLLKFLSTTLLHKANHLIEKHLRRPHELQWTSHSASSDPLERLPAGISEASALAQRHETFAALHVALGELTEKDHEVIVLRGIEQLTNLEVALLLGLTPGAATRRYQRALAKLRIRLPGSILDELPHGAA